MSFFIICIVAIVVLILFYKGYCVLQQKKLASGNKNLKGLNTWAMIALLAIFAIIIFFISQTDVFYTIFVEGSRNVGKPKETKYDTCSWCGDRVPEDDMRGNWCKDCQNDAFGKDGWYKE